MWEGGGDDGMGRQCPCKEGDRDYSALANRSHSIFICVWTYW